MAIVAMLVADMNPVAFHDELVIRKTVTDVHVSLSPEWGGHYDVGSFATHVLTVSYATYELVDIRLAIATGDKDRTAELFA